MSGAAELFTVCGSCGQQVSAFVTECPYCGNRLRKRAPKLDRKDGDLEALFAQLDTDDPDVALRSPTPPPKKPWTSRFRRGGKRAVPTVPKSKPARSARPRTARRTARWGGAETRPWATIAIVLISLIGLPVTVAIGQEHVWFAGALDGDSAWRLLTSSVTYVGTWHALGVLTCLGVFGWLWERRAGPRLGPLLVLGTFLVAGVGGLALASQVDADAIHTGAAGAAVALATAWIVAELQARRRNESIDGDLLGASVLLAVAVLVSAVTPSGAAVAAVWGLVVGLALGLGLSAARR